MTRLALALAAVAALMGAAGVALAAAAVHLSGGELARTASLFLMLHAGALIGVSAHARLGGGEAKLLVWAGAATALGASLFAAELTIHAFLGFRIFPFAAPIGGTLTILGWLAIAVTLATA